jgi:hypothetical protein
MTPRVMKTWARVLACLLIAGMTQPNLVMCFEPGGQPKLEIGSSWPSPVSDPASSPACAGNCQDEVCDSCVDVPVLTTAICRDLSEMEATAVLKVGAYMAAIDGSPESSVTNLHSPSPLHTYYVNIPLCTIRSTILLI